MSMFRSSEADTRLAFVSRASHPAPDARQFERRGEHERGVLTPDNDRTGLSRRRRVPGRVHGPRARNVPPLSSSMRNRKWGAHSTKCRRSCSI
jgi:hypothetical protein